MIINKQNKTHFVLLARFDEDKTNDYFKKEKVILDNASNLVSTIYLGKKEDFSIKKLDEVFEFITSIKERSYQIIASSFLSKHLNEKAIVKSFIYQNTKNNGKKFDLKTANPKPKQVNHLIITKFLNKDFEKDYLIASQISEATFLQDSAPNILTINKMVDYAKKLVSNNPNLKLKILDTKDLKKLGMNLILAVNAGSSQEAKCLVLEYKHKDYKGPKTALVGKGIIFDSGGYNLKPSAHIQGMKYDMSGAAIALLTIDTVAKLKLKNNICAVLPITDNLINEKGQLPESIFKSFSGINVEVVDTDAEGRLILADAISYAAKIMKADTIIDIATLTGTVIYALGKYSGVWASTDGLWERIMKSASNQNELVWRMPLDKEFITNLSKETFADILSCSKTEKPDSNIAAAWLNEFALGKQFIHLDIAGSADVNGKGQAPLLKTLIDFFE